MTTDPSAASGWTAYLTPMNLLLLVIPVAAVLHFTEAAPLWVFVTSGLGIIPLAGLLGRATEGLAARYGGTIGGLLNATFGNAAELIIAMMLLYKGKFETVKATITGSILGNLLLVLGLAILVGGLRRRSQQFDRTHAGVGATLLAIASVGLIVPTLFYYLYKSTAPEGQFAAEALLSEEIAVVLMVIYGLSLLFTLKTHRSLTDTDSEAEAAHAPEHGHGQHAEWGVKLSLAVLTGATVAVAIISEWFVGSIESAAHTLGMNDIFIGVIVVAVVGNAAEHFTAVIMAWKNKMDVAIQIAVGSSIQVALFVAPVLVFASLLMGHTPPLDLHFSPLEAAAVVLSVAVIALVCHDGESHWLEGAMLLAVYLIFALAFFNIPMTA